MTADVAANVGMTHGEALGLAETWAARGVPAFVLEIVWNVDKGKTDKIPLTAHGHLDATTDVRQLRHMFNSATLRRGGVLGVGLHPGPAGYLAVDVDEDDNLTRYDERDLCTTYTVTTARGNGRHHWYSKREPVRVGIVCEWPEVDVVRSDDGFVVAPGTSTPWGTWQAFDEFPDDVAECPVELWAALTCDGRGSNGSSPVAGRGDEAVVAELREAGRDQDAEALTVLCEQHGGHHPFIRNDGAVFVTRPDKSAGTSASVGYVAPGVVKVFTTGWPGLTADHRYIAGPDELVDADLLETYLDTQASTKASSNGDGTPTRAAGRSPSHRRQRSNPDPSNGCGTGASHSAPSPCSEAAKASARAWSPTSSPPTSPAASSPASTTAHPAPCSSAPPRTHGNTPSSPD